MPTRQKIAFTGYLIVALVSLVFGLIYMFKGQFMSYHAAAMDVPWDEIPFQYQVLINALMKAYASGCIAMALALFLIIWIPFRKQQKWSFWAIPLIIFVQCMGTLVAQVYFASNTSATPPFWAIGFSLLVAIIGSVCTLNVQQLVHRTVKQ